MRTESVVAVGFVVLACFGAMTPAAATGTQETPEESFVVDLEADGSATVTVTTTFDLTDTNESDAFQELADDQQVRERFRTNFRDRMQLVASSATNTTGREMSITNATIDFRTVGSTGVVEQSVTWSGLAAVESDTLTLTEPFTSGFAPERTYQLAVPEGYEVTSVAPQQDSQSGHTLTWEAGTDLQGFVAVVEPTDDMGESTTAQPTSEMATTTGMSTDTSSGSGPGLGAGLAGIAVLAGTILIGRRS